MPSETIFFTWLPAACCNREIRLNAVSCSGKIWRYIFRVRVTVPQSLSTVYTPSRYAGALGHLTAVCRPPPRPVECVPSKSLSSTLLSCFLITALCLYPANPLSGCRPSSIYVWLHKYTLRCSWQHFVLASLLSGYLTTLLFGSLATLLSCTLTTLLSGYLFCLATWQLSIYKAFFNNVFQALDEGWNTVLLGIYFYAV